MMRSNQVRSTTLLILLLLSSPVSAQNAQMAEAPEIEPPVANKNYAPFPQPDNGYVTDHANLLPPQQHEQLEKWLYRAEKDTGVEVVVLTIPSLQTYPGTPQSIEPFATQLFNTWGVGNLPKNDGVLIVVSPGDRKARIELGAHYGTRSDADAVAIMDDMVDEFRDGDYPAGIDVGVRGALLEFAGVRIGWNWPLICVLASIPILGLVAYSLFKNGKRGWGWVVVGIIGLLIFLAFRLIQAAARSANEDSGGWGSGGWSGGFGGSFGGGSSGGGGATGSW